MTLRYLLDTNIASAPMAKQPNLHVVERLSKHGSSCAIPAPVWYELNYGCRRLAVGKRRAALENYLEMVVRESFPVLPYDEDSALWHGHERARLEAKGQAAPYVDGQIAAIAHVHQLVLVTANAKDFANFSDLVVEDWTLPGDLDPGPAKHSRHLASG